MNTKKLVKYIIMGAIMVLMIDSMPPKGIGDDTVLFLNPVVNPPPPDVGILLDTSGSMTSLPCAVPDKEDACGIEQNNSNSYFKTQLNYHPNTDYGYDASNPTCFDSNVNPGGEGCFYGGTSKGSNTEGPLANNKPPSGSHVYINSYFLYPQSYCSWYGWPSSYCYPSNCSLVTSKGPGGTIPSYYYDCGTIAYFCSKRGGTTLQQNACINQLLNYGYFYSGNVYGGGDSAFYTGNLLDFYPPKFIVTRKVISDLIDYDLSLISTNKGVRIGIFSFTCQQTDRSGNCTSWGAQTDVDMSPTCAMLGTPPTRNNYLNSIYSLTWNNSTPLAGAAVQVGSYFANNKTNATWYDTLACEGSTYCSAGATNAGGAGTSSDSWCGTGNSASNSGGPFPCEKNFMIIMTDGNENVGPNGLTDWPIGSYQNANYSDGGACSTAPNGTCNIAAVAGFLNANSIRPPAEAACTTNIDTYTIGFAGTSADGQVLNTYALQRAAQLGQGLFAPASSWQTLETALFTFFANIIQKNRTFGTPSLPQIVTEGISATGTTTNNVFKAFIASFIPKNQNFWVGHLREYTGAASTTGTISLYDKNGVPFTGNTSTIGQCSFSEYVPPPIWDAGADLSDTTLPACSSTPGPGQPPCYLAPNLRTVYTVTPGLLSGFMSATTSLANGDWTWSAGGDIALGAGQLFTTSNTNLSPSDFGVTDTTTMDNIIDYVLGPKHDGIHVLGDIFHSDPTLVSTDALAGDWVQLSDPQIISLNYQQYLNAVYNRPQIVVAGADDGMIHAFYAGGYEGSATFNGVNYVPDGNAKFDYGTGQEVWAFIPKDLLPKLQYMQNPALVPTTTTGQYWTTEGIYTTTSTTHVYYVDASPFVRDVYLQGVDNGLGLSGNAAYWHTIMIIGERLGGTYYICLDITNTLHPKFMWEFTTNNMGFTFGEVAPNPPPIGPIWLKYDPSTGSSVANPILRWIVMLNGGWDPGFLTPTRGNAYYVVDIATGKLVWKYDQSDDPNMVFPTAATPIGITQGILGTIHPWWMESFLPDLGGQLWQFSFLHIGDNPPGSWAGSLGSNNIVKTCLSTADTNCFSGQRIFAAQTPVPSPLSQAQQFFYQPSAIGDPCNDMWIGLASGNRDNPLSCTPVNYLYEINSPMPYVPQVPLLTGSNLTQLTSLSGINTGLCGAGSGWYIPLSSFTGTASGTKSLSIPYATGGVEYFSVFTPDQNACVTGSSQFSCNTLGGTGTMVGMAIYQIPGTGYKTGQVVFSKSTNQGIPSPPIPVTSIVGTNSGGPGTASLNPFTMQICGTGAGSMALSTQIYGATSEGAIFNAGSISGANMLMYPILQLCIPKDVESTFMNPLNTWSSHGGR